MEEREGNSRGAGYAIAGGVLLLLPVLYLLGVGPSFWISTRFPATEEFLHGWLYAPIGLISDNCKPFKVALTWYMHFWV